jgi:hypothetical protein
MPRWPPPAFSTHGTRLCCGLSVLATALFGYSRRPYIITIEHRFVAVYLRVSSRFITETPCPVASRRGSPLLSPWPSLGPSFYYC